MGVKLKYEDVKFYINNTGYELISTTYVNSSEKLEIKCNKGHLYKASFSKFKLGRRCPVCSNKVKITKEVAESELKKEGYTLISDFTNGNSPIDLLCPEGHRWSTILQKFRKGARCSHCSGKYIENRKEPIRWNTKMVKQILCKDGYTLLSDYKNAQTKIKVKCPNDHTRKVYFNHYLKGHRCGTCSWKREGQEQLLADDFIDDFLSTIGYKRVGKYLGYTVNMDIICDTGHLASMSYSNLKAGVRCKYCHFSKGEKVVMDILERNNIDYDREIPIRDKHSGRMMYFDFAIFNNQGEFEFYIEYDGTQHFRESGIYDADLENGRMRDRRKNRYCDEKEIPLLRIPYTEIRNIESIILNYNKSRVIPKFEIYRRTK